MQLDVEKLADGDACEFAKQRYYSIARWRNLWTVLVFILGVFITGLLVLTLILVLNNEFVQAAISGATSIVGSAPMAFILQRRKEAKAEEDSAYNDVHQRCGATDDVEGARKNLTFLGVR